MIVPIVQTPQPVLLRKTKNVPKVDKKILSVLKDMKDTLLATRKPKGVGLAAPQIGESLAIFITKSSPDSQLEIFLNPQITWSSSEKDFIQRETKGKHPKDEKNLEGCLSIDNVWGHVARAKSVQLRYIDVSGKTHEKKYSGFMATIIQHETDHLNGILFTTRVLEQHEKIYKIEEKDDGKEELVEIKI